MTETTTTDLSGHASHGVEALIEKLHDQGVASGQARGDALISDAKKRSIAIVTEARQQADEIIQQARKEADAYTAAGRDALELAVRDAHLKLRELVMNRFSDEVRHLVGQIMEPDAFMAELVLRVASRARDQAGMDREDKITIELPQAAIGIDDLRKHPEELKEGTLAHLVLSIMANLLRDGIVYHPASDLSGGIKVYLKEGDVEVDLTDEAVAAVLMEHLQPRFRALLEGVVK